MPRRAFTLIELLVVISIIGLLSSVAVVSMSSSRSKARLAAGQQFAATVNRSVGDQIVGEWNFDECSGTAAGDASGNGNNGTFVGSPAWSTNTPSGRGCSINFPSLGSYVNVPDSSSLDLSDNFTLSFWVNLNSSAYSVFLIKGNQTVNGLVPAYDANVNGFFLSACNVSNYPAAPKGTDAGVWHQIVGTTANNKRTLYIDGHLAGTSTSGGNSWNNSINFTIGQGAGYSANALLDEVRVYGGALTAMRVHEIYAEESARHNLASGGLRSLSSR